MAQGCPADGWPEKVGKYRAVSGMRIDPALLERVGGEVAEHERVREKVKTGFMSMEVSGKGRAPVTGPAEPGGVDARRCLGDVLG